MSSPSPYLIARLEDLRAGVWTDTITGVVTLALPPPHSYRLSDLYHLHTFVGVREFYSQFALVHQPGTDAIGTSTTLRRFVSKRYNASSIYSTMKQSYQLIKLFALSITKNIWVCLTASGVYMYMETSSPRTQGDRTRIDSIKAIAPATGVCVRFWYHMYGAGMGSLTMHTGDDNGGLGPSRWSRTGDSGQMWREGWSYIGYSGSQFQVRSLETLPQVSM